MFLHVPPIGWELGAGLTIAHRSSATSSSSTVTGPSDIASGDILVLRDYASSSGGAPSTAIPSGFTSLVNHAALNSGGFYERSILSYKLADGTEASASLTGMNGNDENKKVLVVFSAGATTLATGGTGSSGSNGDPSSLAINASGGTAPLVVIGGYSSTRVLTVDTMTPTEDGRAAVGTGGDAAVAWKIYNSSPANVTIDMGDEDSGGANFNVMTGAWIEAT